MDIARNNHIRSIAALLVIGLFIGGCGSSDAETTDSGEPSVLSIQVGDDVRFADDRLSFTSEGTVPWFADRPGREVGMVSLDDLAGLWDQGGTFSNDPPNAAVLIDSGEPVVLELLALDVNGEYVTYETRTLLGTPPAAGDKITLVIDHLCMVDPLDC